MMILMHFCDDLDAVTIKLLVERDYHWSEGDTAFDRFAMLLTLTDRTIPQISYEVKFSTQILRNPKYPKLQPVVHEITDRLRAGQSLHSYLSSKAMKSRRKDELLLSWGIHHLHLNSINTRNSAGFVERKYGETELLFLRIEGRTAYLIEIVSHSDEHRFVNPRLLEIVDENWPELHYESKILTGNKFSPEEIANLRRNRVNYLIHINGRNIMPKMSVGANGVPIEVQMMYRVLCDELMNVEADVRRRFYEYFPYEPFSTQRMPAIPEVRLIGIEDDHFVLQEQATKRLCQARRVSAQK